VRLSLHHKPHDNGGDIINQDGLDLKTSRVRDRDYRQPPGDSRKSAEQASRLRS
jgi:hypothetical protein